METLTLECLRCGETRQATRNPWRRMQTGECPRCGYVGYATAGELTEGGRRALRDRPLERRRLYAV